MFAVITLRETDAVFFFCDLIPVEVRMLVDDDLICEDIDLADCDDSFAYVKRIAFPAFYARQNKRSKIGEG